MRTSKIQNGHQGAPKGPTGSGKGYTPGFLGAPVNFSKISFLIRAEKVVTENKWWKRIGKVVHYRRASPLPEWLPTGTATPRANIT